MLCKLRNANDRYARIAEKIRATRSRQRRRYRIRAACLGLHVDIDAAVALCERHVSKIPLPIIDTTTPTLVESKIATRVQPLQVPSITTTAPTPLGLSEMSEMNQVNKVYSPIPLIRIPIRGPLIRLDSMDWNVPTAPSLRPKALPEVLPEAYCETSSPMLVDSASSGLSTSGDRFPVRLRIKLPSKRKIRDTGLEDTFSHKHHLRKRWAKTPSTRRVSPRAVRQPHVYF